MKDKFYVSHDGEQVGPFTVDEIVAQIKSAKLSMMDYVFDDTSEDWVSFLEHTVIKGQIKNLKPSRAPKPSKKVDKINETKETKKDDKIIDNSDDLNSEWFILKGENKFGPFAFSDVLKMLQEKVVFEFDFVWKPGMETWSRIAELNSFKSENITKLKETLMPEIKEVFFRRRHKRIDYGGTVLVHDNKSVWKGQGVEISAGGAGVVMENAMILPGQQIYLHFKPGDGVPPFNAVCEVVSKQYTEGVQSKSAKVRYGLKFVNLSVETQNYLIKHTSKAKAA